METSTASTTGTFSYMAPASEPSLLRNGKVYTKRDTDGSDSKFIGVDLVKHDMTVHDARQMTGSDRPTLERNGFELIDRPLADSGLDFMNHERVVKEYYPQCEPLVREVIGQVDVSPLARGEDAGKKSSFHLEADVVGSREPWIREEEPFRGNLVSP